MPSVEANGVHINYVQIPCESGEDAEHLVVVHGLATNLAFWYFTHASMFSKRFHVTLYDLRGHGRSGVTESGYTAPNMAVDLEKLLDYLGIERAHFVAHSFGGAVLLNLACLKPASFASLALLDTHIHAVRQLGNTEWKFAGRIKRILDRNKINIDVSEAYFGYKLLSEIARLKVRNEEITQELEDLVRPLMGANSNRTARQWLKLTETTRAQSELMGDDGLTLEGLRKLDFPILAVYGERSQSMTTGEHFLKVWPHADFRRIRDSGHFFPVTHPRECMEACRQFWNGSLISGVPHRKEDSSNKKFFRSDRFYIRDGKWFFDTRESSKMGPFNDLSEAKAALSR